MYQLCKALIQLMAATPLIMTYDSSVNVVLAAKTSTGKGKARLCLSLQLELSSLVFACAGGMHFEAKGICLKHEIGLKISPVMM